MAEGLVSLIIQKRSAVISKWFDSALQAYSPDTAAFLKSQKDQFSNPVGSNTRRGLEGLFDQLTGAMNPDLIAGHLDSIMRIRAVQSLSPSQATAFLFALKDILRGMLGKELQDPALARQFADIEGQVDRMGLAAFDVYMACREKIYELKANESRNRLFKAFERAGLVAKDPDTGPGA